MVITLMFTLVGGDYFFVVARFVLGGFVWSRGLVACLLVGQVVFEPGIWMVLSRVGQGLSMRV